MQPRVSTEGAKITPEDIVKKRCGEFLELLPEDIDERKAHPETFKILDTGAMVSLGVFAKQECARFNKLLNLVRRNLGDLIKAIDGTLVMSQVLEEMFNSFINNKVPVAWLDISVGYPSLKPLASWVSDLVDRLKFISSWVYNGPPNSYWLSSFFFPQGFMTAAMQSYARETMKPIDTLSFRTHVLDIMEDEVESPQEVGV
jgi:dynein heavy chain